MHGFQSRILAAKAISFELYEKKKLKKLVVNFVSVGTARALK